METVDLDAVDVRVLNQRLQRRSGNAQETSFEVLNPMGRHSLAVGLMHTVEVRIRGHAGYYCAGMNERANVVVDGNAGVGVAENMMSGTVRVRGDASHAAGATAHGGLLVIEGDASARCGIALKGADIVVGGSVGHMSAFMAQAGRLVVCGDAGANLGDSIYEAELYVQGTVESLGADCEEKELTAQHRTALQALLDCAEIRADAGVFRRYGSARQLYHFKVDHAGSY